MAGASTSTSIRQLPPVLAATFSVIGLPLLAVSLLRATGAVDSVLLLVVAGTGLSLLASWAGAALWAKRRGGGDTVFGDLMLWGWLRRRRQERQLAGAMSLLGLRGDQTVQPSLEQRARALEKLAAALEARYPDTHGHSRRVARHAVAIAKRMSLPREQVSRIRAAAAVHDVGKVEIPEEIVNKPGPLSDDEFAVVKRHPVDGARMVAALEDEELTRIVRHHHERLDGMGYPDGLAGEEIPLGARVIAVADTFDAITSTRPYRSARRHREALELLAAEAGTQLDPDAVRAFRRYYSGLRPVALWSLLLNGPRQLLTVLGDQLRFGGMSVAAQTTAAAVATVAAGSLAVGALSRDGEAQEAEALATGAPVAAQRPAAHVDAGPDAQAPRRGRAPSEEPDRTAGAPPAAGDQRLTATGGEGTTSSGVDAESPRGGGSTGGGGSGSGGDGGSGGGDRGSPGRGTPIRDTVDEVTDPVGSLVGDEPVGSTLDGTKDTVDSTVGGITDTVNEVADNLPGTRRLPDLGLGAG